MKTTLIAAAALSLLAAPAFAQVGPVGPGPSTASQTVAVTGSVAKLCGLGNQSGGGTGGHTATVALGSIVDANGQLAVAPQNIGFGNVWCNAPASVTLSATQLTTTSPVTDTSSFVNALDLIVDNDTGTGGSIFAYLGSATSIRSSSISHALNQEFETGTGRFTQARLSVALPASVSGNDRPVAGSYTGSITFKVSPQ